MLRCLNLFCPNLKRKHLEISHVDFYPSLSLSLQRSVFFPPSCLITTMRSETNNDTHLKGKIWHCSNVFHLFESCTTDFGPRVNPASRCDNDTCHALLSARVFQVIVVGRRPSRRRRHRDRIQAFSVMWLLKASGPKMANRELGGLHPLKPTAKALRK